MMLDQRSGEMEYLMVKESARRTRRKHNPTFKARVALAAPSRTLTPPRLQQNCDNFVVPVRRRPKLLHPVSSPEKYFTQMPPAARDATAAYHQTSITQKLSLLSLSDNEPKLSRALHAFHARAKRFSARILVTRRVRRRSAAGVRCSARLGRLRG